MYLLPPETTDLCKLLKFHVSYAVRSRGTSVIIVRGYGLDNRAIGVRSPAGAWDFSSSLSVQTGSRAHPASYPMGTGGPFHGAETRPRRGADHSPPILFRGKEWTEAIFSLRPSASMPCDGTALLYYPVRSEYTLQGIFSGLHSLKFALHIFRYWGLRDFVVWMLWFQLWRITDQCVAQINCRNILLCR
jgi:hypothetical protein